MKRVLQFLLLLLLGSCNSFPEDSLQFLYRQRIQGSNLVLYEFSYAGGFAWSGDYHRLGIMDSSVSFSKDEISELPFVFATFSAKPTPEKFEMIHITSKGPLSPIDTIMAPTGKQSKTVHGIKVDVTEYHQTYGSGVGQARTGNMTFHFDSLNETEDSIIFYNVKQEYGIELSSTKSFPKGNIVVEDSAKSDLDYIKITVPIIRRAGVVRGDTKSFDVTPNQPVVGTAFYYFYPTTPLKATALSDYGIFKRIK